jgi:threonine synthase
MEQLGWVSGRRPKMIAIQAAGCAPVARAFQQGEPASQMWQNAHTFASGLRVPKPYGDVEILRIVRESGGTVLTLTDDQIFASLLDWARHEGLLLSPEAAAGAAAGAAGAVVDDGLSDLDSALLVSLEEEDSEAGSLLLAA